jgi:hypothetical protein
MNRRFNLLLSATLFGAMHCAFAQQLKVVLEIPTKTIYRSSKNIFKVSITNISANDVWIYRDLYKGLEIWVKTEAGKDLEPTLIGALCPPPPPTPEDFLCLKPGQVVSNVDDRSPAELGVKRRGKFTAVAAYYYQVEVRATGEKILHLVDPAVESSPIKFEVH